MENDRKNQIVKAAVKRFARHGLKKTTLAEIAGDLRIGKATIYHYFSSKEVLFYAALKYDASLYLEDLKNIFNNESLGLKERFVEYFQYKDSLQERYKLLFNLFVSPLISEEYKIESETVKEIIESEEEIVKLALSSLYSNKIESMNPVLPSFLVYSSWGLMFGNRLKNIITPEAQTDMSELINKSLENIFG
ncbi:MAG: TetR/AcrR family transcriptional regulator [Ignavibacteriaceae bacterium]